jgi:hypothetical protein
VTPDEVVRRAFDAFRIDAEALPPLTLRGGNAVDGYDEAEPFDAARDQPTDTYIEAYTFWGLGYLDAQSWRHYLPRLIDYALRRPDDPAMAAEALIRSLRPPDRYPPRLGTLSTEQEAAVVAFLEMVVLADGFNHLREDAQRSGLLCGDVPTIVAINVMPLADRHLSQITKRAAAGLRAASVDVRPVRVEGASRSERLDGLTRGESPAEPERVTIVAAGAHDDAVLLTVRSWPRNDVEAAIELIVGAFAIVAGAAR